MNAGTKSKLRNQTVSNGCGECVSNTQNVLDKQTPAVAAGVIIDILKCGE